MTNHTWWVPDTMGLAWVVGMSAFAGLVALSHNLKKQLRVELRNRERVSMAAR